jgi:Mlc titration factor MtfA (ptsG expression regulator)
MFSLVSHWRHERIIQRSSITETQWATAFQRLPLLHSLKSDEQQALKRLAILFLHYKSLEATHDLEITQDMALIIALQACLPILNLGFDWYDGWISVVVYPAQFIPERAFVDEYGVEHRTRSVLSGESWHKGPVILSWEDTAHGGIIDGHNLVIHEFAHKLDGLNGATNGFPPLHKNMDGRVWTSTLSQAFEDLQSRVQHGLPVPIDDYAATSPAEFFAVFSEVFFERPDILTHYYPAIYQQFQQFYRQDTLQRMQSRD